MRRRYTHGFSGAGVPVLRRPRARRSVRALWVQAAARIGSHSLPDWHKIRNGCVFIAEAGVPESIPISSIQIGIRQRALHSEAVVPLAESIRTVGLLNPMLHSRSHRRRSIANVDLAAGNVVFTPIKRNGLGQSSDSVFSRGIRR